VMLHHQLPSDIASQTRRTSPQFRSFWLHFVCPATFRFTEGHLALCYAQQICLSCRERHSKAQSCQSL